VAPEHVGRPVRCPGCKSAFSVRPEGPSPGSRPGLAPPSPPAPDEEELLVLDGLDSVSVPPAALRLEVGSATSPGQVRDRNEDSHLALSLTWSNRDERHELALLVVVDGMGGHASGDRASSLTLQAMLASLAPVLAELVGGGHAEPAGTGLADALERALRDANAAVRRASEAEAACAGMGATVAAALVRDDRAAIAHVGDCRVYHARAGELTQVTRDQTLVARMVELGQLSAREAQVHPAASQVTQALGRQGTLVPSRHALSLEAGDWLLLACDGLHAHIDAAELREAVTEAAGPAALAQELVRRADESGGSDNCTVVALRCG
jgi:protein phosphatase